MTPEMREALLASIEHWKENLAAGVFEAKIRGADCPLCNATRDEFGNVVCEKCPVMQWTGEESCEDSPWYDVDSAFSRGNASDFAIAAKRQIAFLESLLPENEAPDAQ